MAEEHIRRKNINRGFRKLDIWQLSIDYYKMIVTVMSRCVSIPYKVKAQIEDSALSISSNIAEDYARRSPKENLKFNEIALSSTAESYSQIHALKAAGQIKLSGFVSLDTKLYEIENKIIQMNKCRREMEFRLSIN